MTALRFFLSGLWCWLAHNGVLAEQTMEWTGDESYRMWTVAAWCPTCTHPLSRNAYPGDRPRPLLRAVTS